MGKAKLQSKWVIIFFLISLLYVYLKMTFKFSNQLSIWVVNDWDYTAGPKKKIIEKYKFFSLDWPIFCYLALQFVAVRLVTKLNKFSVSLVDPKLQWVVGDFLVQNLMF